MWNPRKKTNSRPEYSYAPIGSRWAIYHWKESSNISTGDKVTEFFTREEARKECYRLNGWKDQAPKS